jgi:hypothetical protein
VVVRSKAYVCGRFVAGIAGSDPAEGMDVRLLCLLLCCVGSGPCDEPITHSEGSYCVCVCVFNCVRVTDLNNEAV